MTKKEPLEQNLEDMLRAAAANGELTHLSITPVAGNGPDGLVWAASYSPASNWANGFGRDADPVNAIKMAMQDFRLGKVVNELRKTLETAAPKNKRAAKALKNLPEPVDDSDFL